MKVELSSIRRSGAFLRGVVPQGATLFLFGENEMTCCFIGHRKIENRELVFERVKEVVGN